LEDGKTEKEILDELNKMCNYFPKEDERAECDGTQIAVSSLIQTIGVSVGDIYGCYVRLSNVSAGSLRLFVGNYSAGASYPFSTDGEHVAFLTQTNVLTTGQVFVQADVDFVGRYF